VVILLSYILEMSSWVSTLPSKRIILGYRQKYPEGKFIVKTKEATVVSSYYEFNSKHTVEQYKIWIRLFLESISCYLVFFTDLKSKDFIEDCRKLYKDKTHIIILDKSEWNANKYGEEIWNKQFEKDDEKGIHKSPELYKIWYEKKEFVKKAIELNPFNHDDFVWTDAGFLGRRPEIIQLIKNYPNANRIPTNKMLMLNYFPFTLKDNIEMHGIIGGGSGKPRIQGAIMGGHKDVWYKYDTIYDSMIQKYIKADLFMGKDQTIMASIVLNHKDIISLLELKDICPESWFYLGLFLGVNEKLYSLFMSEKDNSVKKTYKQMLNIV